MKIATWNINSLTVRLPQVLSWLAANPVDVLCLQECDVPDLPAEVAGFEPHLALDGGADGLDVYRRILDGARAWLRPGGLLGVELDERMCRIAATEAQEWYEEIRVVADLTGRDRIVTAKTRR